jgi:hypothetical protein
MYWPLEPNRTAVASSRASRAACPEPEALDCRVKPGNDVKWVFAMGRRHCEKLQEALESKSLFDLCACPSRGAGRADGCRLLLPPPLWGRVGEGVFGRMPKSPPAPHSPPVMTRLDRATQYTRRCRWLLGPPVSLCSPGDDIGDSVARMHPRPRIGGQCGDHRPPPPRLCSMPLLMLLIRRLARAS